MFNTQKDLDRLRSLLEVFLEPKTVIRQAKQTGFVVSLQTHYWVSGVKRKVELTVNWNVEDNDAYVWVNVDGDGILCWDAIPVVFSSREYDKHTSAGIAVLDVFSIMGGFDKVIELGGVVRGTARKG